MHCRKWLSEAFRGRESRQNELSLARRERDRGGVGARSDEGSGRGATPRSEVPAQ